MKLNKKSVHPAFIGAGVFHRYFRVSCEIGANNDFMNNPFHHLSPPLIFHLHPKRKKKTRRNDEFPRWYHRRRRASEALTAYRQLVSDELPPVQYDGLLSPNPPRIYLHLSLCSHRCIRPYPTWLHRMTINFFTTLHLQIQILYLSVINYIVVDFVIL